MHFVYLPDAISPLEQQVGGQSYSIHTDHVGKIQELIDDQGQIVWRWEGNAWGEAAPSVSAAAVQCPFGFPGQILYTELGISYNRNRCYFPQSWHFLSPDPVGLWAGNRPISVSIRSSELHRSRRSEVPGKESDDPTLYRGDSRPPNEICSQGFAPQNPSAGLSLAQHVEGVPQEAVTGFQRRTINR